MRDRTTTLMLAGALLCACGDPPPPPTDGSTADAGPGDSGVDDAGLEPDGGSEPTGTEILEESRADLGAVDTAVLAIPADMRVDGAFLQLELVEARLDAIIGEKGSGAIDLAAIIGEKGTTLSLRPISIQAMVVAQQLDAAIRELDAMIADSVWGATGEPDLITLENACVALRDGLLPLRDRIWSRFSELVRDTVLTPRDDSAFVDTRVVDVIGTNAIDVVIEGRSAADPTATIETSCGSSPPDVRILDTEAARDAEGVPVELASATGTGGVPTVIDVTLGHDDVRVLRVEITVTDVPGWVECTVSVTGRRRLRGAREVIDSTEAAAVSGGDVDWSAAAGGIQSQIASGGIVPPDRIGSLESFSRDASAAVSRLRTLARSPTLDEEDYEIHALTLREVILPMSDTILADPGIASDAMLTGHIQTWTRVIGELLVDTAPGHTGATL